MNKYIFKILALVFIASLIISFGCARSCEKINRTFQTSDREYWVEMYSGGKLIKEYHFKGILNNQENSDGYYFYKNDTLIEIGGDVIVKSIK